MNLGSKSIIFGVHNFLWHPITVALAWRSWHKRWPKRWEWIAIFCHDLGYWGCNDIDGACGKEHPWAGALVANYFAGHRALDLVLGHSKSFCQLHGLDTTDLYAPDKLCVLFDPPWFYLLRANLTGEIHEYMRNGPEKVRHSQWAWIFWYREKVRSQFYGKKD